MFIIWLLSVIYVVHIDDVRASQEEKLTIAANQYLGVVCGVEGVNCEVLEQGRLHDVFHWSNPGCYVFVQTRVFVDPEALALLEKNLSYPELDVAHKEGGVYSKIEQVEFIRSERNPSFILIDLNTYMYVDPLTISEWIHMFN